MSTIVDGVEMSRTAVFKTCWQDRDKVKVRVKGKVRVRVKGRVKDNGKVTLIEQ